MRDDEAITQWMLRLGKGDQAAASRLWEEYFDKLARLARRKLEGMPLRDVDEEDVALSAMNSFCQGVAKRKFPALENRTDLWKLLVTLTARKATARLRKHYAQKRGGGGVRGESYFQKDANEEVDYDRGIGGVLGKEPTPELAMEVAADCQHYLELLDDEVLRQIALLTLEGYRTEEIAAKLSCVRRTVERKLGRIREIWSQNAEIMPMGDPE